MGTAYTHMEMEPHLSKNIYSLFWPSQSKQRSSESRNSRKFRENLSLPPQRIFESLIRVFDLITEIELLEEEVINHEQQVLSLYRSVFEQCVSRSTSQQSSVIASPAHTRQGSRKHPSIISSAFCS
ncbi:hypothetical protein JHK87_012350 [Glycine soja]|nr:hypothetical protein JHK87_012350 [Glycine soja]